MSEGCTEIEARLEAVEKSAASLGSRIPRVRDPVLGRRIAQGLDTLLRNVVSGWGAIDLAIGEGLDALSVGLRAMDLKYSNIGDYAREELGINASTAAKMARLARKLQERPILRLAVRQGKVTPRKAEIIAPLAVGENELPWVLRGIAKTVRSLKAEVKAAGKAPPEPDDEKWVNFSSEVSPEKRAMLEEGLRLAGIVIGATATKMQRVNAWGQEYLSSHSAPADDQADNVLFSPEDQLEALKARLEQENDQWAGLAKVGPVKAEEFSGETDPWRIDAELKHFVEKRSRWDQVFGRAAMLFKRSRAWVPLGFTSFGHYCEEMLGMGERTVAQRVALEQSLERMPVLRRALREKRISYEKARLIARHAEGEEVPRWIERAETITCIELRRALQDKDEAQMCARGSFNCWMTVSVAEVVKAAFRAVRAEAKRWLWAGECLFRLAEHFVETWRAHLKDARTVQQRVRARDNHLCQVPGCSRASVHSHHIIPLSQGGTDDPWNLVSLCAAHHLLGIHGGRMRVSGTAPDKLTWEFGLRRTSGAAAALFEDGSVAELREPEPPYASRRHP